MTKKDQLQSEVLQKFSEIVGKSLHIDPLVVTPDSYLDELGAESLDLIEISMETEAQFDVWLPEKSILDTAAEVFGPGVLEKDGYLTEEGKRLMKCRMPDEDAAAFSGEVAVKDLRHYFQKVGTWTRMIESLLEHTPRVCAACGGPLQSTLALRMKCVNCALEVSLRSGEEINREWVKEYHEKEYRSRAESPAAEMPAVESAAAQSAAQ
ncbi:MAG TPA: phosphopantetheine-binding protein [Bryobacteraceae bacterium]|nr:phosphopantetheine-binding protein [Bryobacteraceae bacterium]